MVFNLSLGREAVTHSRKYRSKSSQGLGKALSDVYVIGGIRLASSVNTDIANSRICN
jgi:hypothetical protein